MATYMILHCDLNNKPKGKDGLKPIKIEFENRGYWAKWYLACDAKQAKELFEAEYPEGNYFRSKKK